MLDDLVAMLNMMGFTVGANVTIKTKPGVSIDKFDKKIYFNIKNNSQEYLNGEKLSLSGYISEMTDTALELVQVWNKEENREPLFFQQRRLNVNYAAIDLDNYTINSKD